MARRAELFVRELSDEAAAHLLRQARPGKNAVVRHRAMLLFASFQSQSVSQIALMFWASAIHVAELGLITVGPLDVIIPIRRLIGERTCLAAPRAKGRRVAMGSRTSAPRLRTWVVGSPLAPGGRSAQRVRFRRPNL